MKAIVSLQVSLAVLSTVLCRAMVFPAALEAGAEIVRDRNSWDFAPLLYYDIVVRGVIENVTIVNVDTGDLWMDPSPSNLRTPLLRVSLRQSESERGPDAGGSFTFLCTNELREASDFFQLGREVIVCCKYNSKLRSYYQPSMYGRYWRDAGEWKSQETPRGTRAMSDAQLFGRVHSMDLKHVSGAAELIVEGTITSVVTSQLVGPDSSSAELIRIGLTIKRVLKGSFSDSQVSIVAITRGLYVPAWRSHMPPPVVYKAGQEWLCFLRKNDVGWYPFAGTNGFLRAAETGYVYDERVEFWHSKKFVEQVIKETSAENVR